MANNDMRIGLGVDVKRNEFTDGKRNLADIRKDIENTNDEINELRQGVGSLRGGGLGGGNILDSLLGSRGSASANGASQAINETSSRLENLANVANDTANVIANGGGLMDVLGSVAQISPLASAGLGLFQTALSVFMSEAQASANELNDAIDAQRNLDRRIVDGLTSSQATEEMERLNELRELEAVRLARLEEGWEQMNDEFGVATNVLAELQPQVGGLRENLNESRGAVEDFDRQIEALQDAVESGRLSANDAEEAENALTTARDGAVQSATQAQQELDKQAREKEQSEERITKAYQDASDSADDASRNFRNASDDISKSTLRAGKEAVINAERANRDLVNEAQLSAQQAGRAYNDTIMQANEDLQRDALSALREQQRTIRDTYRNANREQSDLLAERSFLQIDLLSKQTKRELEDIGIGAQDAKAERDIAFKEELDDLRRQHDIENRENAIGLRERLRQLKQGLRDELTDIRRAGQQKLEDARTALNRELEMTQTALQRKLELESQYWSASLGMVGGGRGGNNFGGNTSNQSNNYGGNSFNQTINGAGMSTGQIQQITIEVLRQTGLA